MRRLLRRLAAPVAMLPTRILPWYRWPSLIGLLILALGVRTQLRLHNLYDLRREAPPVQRGRRGRSEADFRRDPGGRNNDLNDPEMGVAGGRFGRNFPPERSHPEEGEALFEPNPRVVSRRLLTRDEFTPATTLNVLAAAWIQFMVHGWFNHGPAEAEDPITLDLEDDDPWPEDDRVDGRLAIRRTRPDPTWSPDEGRPPTFQTATTHWWDASQLYGSDSAQLARIRGNATDGKIELRDDGLLPADGGVDLTGFNDDYWVGLSLLHTLFAREHNAICDALRRANPSADGTWIFERARLINSALLAKIHTVEWTPALLSNPTVVRGMNASWYGLLGRRFKRRFPRVHLGSFLSGMPGSKRDHFGVPYSLTEEFVSVYRLHSLLPDDYEVRSRGDDRELERLNLEQFQGPHTREVIERHEQSDLLYSLGTRHPGAITLHNFPAGLQDLVKNVDGQRVRIDLAALDVMRDRERGVPRYNEFRRLLRMPAINTFEEMTSSPEWADQLRSVYGHVDRVDTQVGMLAEPLPPGFAFSETAFRIFVLMAGRRITSDRFLTDDYRREVYTKLGIDWVEDTTFVDVVLRHHPELAPALTGVTNGFAPWIRAAETTADPNQVGISP